MFPFRIYQQNNLTGHQTLGQKSFHSETSKSHGLQFLISVLLAKILDSVDGPKNFTKMKNITEKAVVS